MQSTFCSRTSGGIPILKAVPLIKEFPLIGWFVKRGGKADEVQQSIVLAQAALFPALPDIIDLLPRPVAVPPFDSSFSTEISTTLDRALP